MIDLNKVEQEISCKKTQREALEYLMYNYPSLFIFVGDIIETENYCILTNSYTDACWNLFYEKSTLNYSLYVHGSFLPELNSLKIDGKIKHGRHTKSNDSNFL